MRVAAGPLAMAVLALVVSSATASPHVRGAAQAPPSVAGTWTGGYYAADDTVTLSSDGTHINASSSRSWVCDSGGVRPLKAGETPPAQQGPVKELFNGSWTDDTTFTATFHFCYTGVFNAILNGVQPPFFQPGTLTGKLSADRNTITYTTTTDVPCNATEPKLCAFTGSGTLTRIVTKKPEANLAIELFPPAPRALHADGTPGTPGRLRLEVGNGGPDEARNVVVSVKFHFGAGKIGKAQQDIAASSILTDEWSVAPDEDCTVDDERDVTVRCTFDTLAAHKSRRRDIVWTFGGKTVNETTSGKNRWRLLIAEIRSHPPGFTYLCASGEVYADTKDPKPGDNHDPEDYPPCKYKTALRIGLRVAD